VSWMKDLKKSNTAFLKIIWPKIKYLCGGGDIQPVEIISDNQIARDLDILCGIDIWQTVEGRGCRGIASRVQFGDKSWGTFTIRKSRDSGARTEYEKRVEAIKDGRFIYPYLMCHAYIDTPGENLLEVGLARTIDVFDAIEKELVVVKTTTNASFLAVNFEDVKDVKIFRPSAPSILELPSPPIQLRLF